MDTTSGSPGHGDLPALSLPQRSSPAQPQLRSPARAQSLNALAEFRDQLRSFYGPVLTQTAGEATKEIGCSLDCLLRSHQVRSRKVSQLTATNKPNFQPALSGILQMKDPTVLQPSRYQEQVRATGDRQVSKWRIISNGDFCPPPPIEARQRFSHASQAWGIRAPVGRPGAHPVISCKRNYCHSYNNAFGIDGLRTALMINIPDGAWTSSSSIPSPRISDPHQPPLSPTLPIFLPIISKERLQCATFGRRSLQRTLHSPALPPGSQQILPLQTFPAPPHSRSAGHHRALPPRAPLAHLHMQGLPTSHVWFLAHQLDRPHHSTRQAFPQRASVHQRPSELPRGQLAFPH
ncbi:hypothetical protein ABH941_004177 [Streptacidiphilus sp. EB103A]